MKTTIELPDELARQVRELATQSGTTMRELMIEGLRHELARRRAARPQVDFVFSTFRGQGLLVEPGDAVESSYGMTR